MLNILNQDGNKKLESGTYYVHENRDSTYYTIFAIVPGLGEVAVAYYNKEEDANAIFAHMILLEGNVQDKMGMFRPTLAVLPKDDPAEISDFLKSNFGYNLFKHKLEKSSKNVK